MCRELDLCGAHCCQPSLSRSQQPLPRAPWIALDGKRGQAPVPSRSVARGVRTGTRSPRRAATGEQSGANAAGALGRRDRLDAARASSAAGRCGLGLGDGARSARARRSASRTSWSACLPQRGSPRGPRRASRPSADSSTLAAPPRPHPGPSTPVVDRDLPAWRSRAWDGHRMILLGCVDTSGSSGGRGPQRRGHGLGG